MKMSELLPVGEQEAQSRRRYDECLRQVMSGPAGKELMLYIIRDLCYFSDVSDDATRATRSAAIRLLERISGATGYQLDSGFCAIEPEEG